MKNYGENYPIYPREAEGPALAWGLCVLGMIVLIVFKALV